MFISEFGVADPSEHKYFLSRKEEKKSEEYTTGRFWIYVKHSFIHTYTVSYLVLVKSRQDLREIV